MQAGPLTKRLQALGVALLGASRDLAPIVAVIAVFQILVLRQPLPELTSVGQGAGKAKTFFGLNLDIRTELFLFLVHESFINTILAAIKEAVRFSDPGTGIAMVLPVEQIAGMESQASRSRR